MTMTEKDNLLLKIELLGDAIQANGMPFEVIPMPIKNKKETAPSTS